MTNDKHKAVLAALLREHNLISQANDAWKTLPRPRREEILADIYDWARPAPGSGREAVFEELGGILKSGGFSRERFVAGAVHDSPSDIILVLGAFTALYYDRKAGGFSVKVFRRRFNETRPSPLH